MEDDVAVEPPRIANAMDPSGLQFDSAFFREGKLTELSEVRQS